MKLTQISVFLENKEGHLYEVAALLGKEGIDIRALNIAESEKFGVLRMVVDQPEKAVETLKKAGFTASKTEIIAVEVNDTPGGLASVLKVFHENKINVEYMYAFVEKSEDKALLVFRVTDTDRGIEILTKNGIRVVGKKDITHL